MCGSSYEVIYWVVCKLMNRITCETCCFFDLVCACKLRFPLIPLWQLKCVCILFVSCGLSSVTRSRQNHRSFCSDLGVNLWILWNAFKCLKYTESAALFIGNWKQITKIYAYKLELCKWLCFTGSTWAFL